MDYREARSIIKGFGFTSLLAEPNSNPKLAKSLGIGVLSAPMHLAPASLSGYNVCPMATRGCIKACLHTAGNPVYMKAKRKARINRTRAYFEAREAFMIVLAREIELHVAAAWRQGMRPAVRLNATSDIRWESVPLVYRGEKRRNLMACFPDVQFYDYTKIANRKNVPSNYHLTFSLADGNDAQAHNAYFTNRMNVAVVFDTKRNRPLPATFNLLGFHAPVIDGDEHDFRPMDASNVIVGLRAKGKAINSRLGFVRKAAP